MNVNDVTATTAPAKQASDEAKDFIVHVKAEFRGHPNVVERFISILASHNKQETDIERVAREISVLFQGEPRILSEFNKFLPGWCRIEFPSGGGVPVVVTNNKVDDDRALKRIKLKHPQLSGMAQERNAAFAKAQELTSRFDLCIASHWREVNQQHNQELASKNEEISNLNKRLEAREMHASVLASKDEEILELKKRLDDLETKRCDQLVSRDDAIRNLKTHLETREATIARLQKKLEAREDQAESSAAKPTVVSCAKNDNMDRSTFDSFTEQQDRVCPDLAESLPLAMEEEVTTQVFDEVDYNYLRNRYLEVRVRTGDDAETAGGIGLRRRVKPSALDISADPKYRKLKARIVLLETVHNDQEIYRLLCELREFEVNRKSFPTVDDDDIENSEEVQLMNIVDLTKDEDAVDVDSAEAVELRERFQKQPAHPPMKKE